MFLYEDIQWTTGDRSGGYDGLHGTEALVGINAGHGIHSVTVPESMTPNITNVVNTSNIGIPGIWMFKVNECMCNIQVDECMCNIQVVRPCLYMYACKYMHVCIWTYV